MIRLLLMKPFFYKIAYSTTHYIINTKFFIYDITDFKDLTIWVHWSNQVIPAFET